MATLANRFQRKIKDCLNIELSASISKHTEDLKSLRLALSICFFSCLMQDMKTEAKTVCLEIAIIGYQSILQIRIDEVLLEFWEETQFHLAKAYQDCTFGDRLNNIEQSISYNWYDAKLGSVRDAIRAYLAASHYSLSPTA